MVTDCALFTLAHLGGISSLKACPQQEVGAAQDQSARTHSHIHRGAVSDCEEAAAAATPSSISSVVATVDHCYERKGAGGHVVLTRGKKDPHDENSEEEEKEEDGEVCKKEALKVLCNVIYNSPRAQERASALR